MILLQGIAKENNQKEKNKNHCSTVDSSAKQILFQMCSKERGIMPSSSGFGIPSIVHVLPTRVIKKN